MKFSNLRQRLRSLSEEAFVPREIFFRSGDRFHHIPITVRTQKIVAMASALAVGWMLYASGSYVVQHFVLASKQGEIERQRLAYFDLLAEVGEYHEQFARITQGLEENQAYLLSVLEKSPAIVTPFASSGGYYYIALVFHIIYVRVFFILYGRVFHVV